MSSYRRFVAYVYRYRNGNKGPNCGFVKVEARNGICTFHFRIQNLLLEDICEIHAFAKKETTYDFVPLETMPIKNGFLHCRVDTDRLHMGGSLYTLEQCSGVICTGNQDEYYGACWNPEAAVPIWTPMKADTADNLADKPILTPSVRETDSSSALDSPAPSSDSDEPTANTTANSVSEPVLASSIGETDSSSALDSRAPNSDSNESPANTTADSVDEPVLAPFVSETDSNSAADLHAPSFDSHNSAAATITSSDSDGPTANTTADITVAYQRRWVQSGPDGSNTKNGFDTAWNHLRDIYPPFDPFEEGGIIEGIKIAPSDIPYLQEQKWKVGSNQFILHGFKNYHHLLLGRIEGQNRCVLGVPGIYDQQEQFMAKMFGFPCFKSIRSCQCKNGKFGYFIRSIN